MTELDLLKAQFPDTWKNILANNTDIALDAVEGARRRDTASVRSKSQTKQPEAAGEAVKRHTTIKMEYIGCVIAENNCYEGFGKTRHMKSEAREWQNDLIKEIQCCHILDWRLPLKITISGVFKNDRERPDIHNLKIVHDGIQKATGLNDKNFHTETIPGVIDKTQRPHILIRIEEL
jgi:hypothetical protein